MENGTGAYAKDGSRDVRLRAVAAVRSIEEVLNAVDARLRNVGRVGRTLRLRWHRGHDWFVWKRREGRGRWQEVGPRIPEEVFWRLRIETRNRVQAIEHWMEVRSAGRRVLHLIEWWLRHVGSVGTETVLVVWTGDEGGRVTWQCRADARILRRGNWRAESGPPEKYMRNVAGLVGTVRGNEGSGRVTKQVEGLNDELAELDRRLGGIRAAARGAWRLYYQASRDTWEFRRVQGSRRSRYLRQGAIREMLQQIEGPEKGWIAEGLELLERRRRLKRVLTVVAVMGEAATRWPGGIWQLRGLNEEGGKARWMATSTRTGVIARRYEGRGNGQPVDEKGTSDWESRDGGWEQ